jgi:two-component system LytT family response regulator
MPAKIKTAIIDDEDLARERLRTLLSKEPDIEIAGEAADGKSAISLIEAERPELVFLDVQMPELDGFEVLRALNPDEMPVVVFVTAHDKFALKAFDVHAVDYLLKPFDRERFKTALDRAIQKIRSQAGANPALNAVLAETKPAAKPLERLLVKTDGRVLLLKVDDIDWIEAADNYVNLHAGKESHMMRETMSSLEGKLPPARFMRVSRSAIVNLERIQELQPMFHGEYVVVLKTGTKITLTRSYRDKLDQLMGKS